MLKLHALCMHGPMPTPIVLMQWQLTFMLQKFLFWSFHKINVGLWSATRPKALLNELLFFDHGNCQPVHVSKSSCIMSSIAASSYRMHLLKVSSTRCEIKYSYQVFKYFDAAAAAEPLRCGRSLPAYMLCGLSPGFSSPDDGQEATPARLSCCLWSKSWPSSSDHAVKRPKSSNYKQWHSSRRLILVSEVEAQTTCKNNLVEGNIRTRPTCFHDKTPRCILYTLLKLYTLTTWNHLQIGILLITNRPLITMLRVDDEGVSELLKVVYRGRHTRIYNGGPNIKGF